MGNASDAMQVSASGMRAQAARMRIISENIANADLVAFYKRELETNQESYLRKRILRYRIDGKRRWFVAARKARAYVWQHGRFEGDVESWEKGLGTADEVKPVKDAACLRLFLYSAEDFRFFKGSVSNSLVGAKWLTEPAISETGEIDAEE